MAIEFYAVVGFLLASYSIVANDAIQTLGTFLASNAQRPWQVLWLFASGIIVLTMLYAWFFLDGDIGFGRLNQIPYPADGVHWWHAMPPLVLLILTRFGIPVSTTFLVLTLFALTGGAATEGVMGKMLLKSFLGYVVAFGTAAVIYLLVSKSFENWILRTRTIPPRTPLGGAAMVIDGVFVVPVADAGSGEHFRFLAPHHNRGRRGYFGQL